MVPIKLNGLWVGLLVALVTAVLAASVAGATPPPHLAGVPAGATATAATRALATATRPLPSPPPTATPTPTPTVSQVTTPPPVPSPTTAPSPQPPPAPTAGAGQIIGSSVMGRPLTAYRVGEGPIKVVLVGNIHGGSEANTHVLVQELLAHFQAYPGEVPPNTSLWLIPTMNPDGLATNHRWNANSVDLNRNADTDLDGCAGNDWSPDTVGYEGSHPGAGGAYPFSEPEIRAVRDFLADASIAVFYHSAAEAIFVDTCQRHAPTARLAQALSESTGYPIPAEGWVGYPITGDLGDYLAGEGVAAVTVELTDHQDPEFDRNLAGVRALLAAADEITTAEASQAAAEFISLVPEQGGNSGIWRYADNTFVHPLALEVLDGASGRFGRSTAYILDGGRVLALSLDQPAAPSVILAPGDDVEGVRILEPLDLAADGDSLLALDRAGDIYRYDPAAGFWTVERYDRPARDTYDHYFVALSGGEEANYLLETTHEQVWRFAGGQMGAAWAKLPQSRDVDVSALGQNVYVLTRAMNSPLGGLFRYRSARQVAAFQPNVDLMHPRQVLATRASVYLLDRRGRRLLALDPESGALSAIFQFTDRRPVSAIWADPTGERLILAGRDSLYFYAEPQRRATIAGGPQLQGPQPHDPGVLEALSGLSMPIEGATVTRREFQMPGAPRHYRLGVHEGLDFYGHTVGVPIDRRTPVLAVADGTVIRALLNYERPTAAQADSWFAQSLSLGYTPPEVLDNYRGMQIWIDHGDGLISRYAHLGEIEPGIVEGATVVRGQVIATVGNSGTPASVRSQTEDVHLHLELWINDHHVGQFLRPIEAREWLEKILR